MSEIEGYRLIITSNAKDDLRRLDKIIAERILKKMIWVAKNVTTVEHDALKGEWSGLYRWRIGDYRVIYALDHAAMVIVVEVIGHRREIYQE